MLKPLTASYEISKQAYDKGIRIDSYFKWAKVYTKLDFKKGSEYVEDKDRASKYVIFKANTIMCMDPDERPEEYFPAPTLEEVLEVMPKTIHVTINEPFVPLRVMFVAKDSYLWYYKHKGDRYPKELVAPNPTEAVMRCLLWLLENNYTTIEEINSVGQKV